jgi:hypothetical protein
VSSIDATTYYGSAAVTKSDTVNDPAGPFAGLLMTAVGTLKVDLIDGSTLTFGTETVINKIFPYAVRKVWSTGTGATVVGLYALPLKAPFNPGAGLVAP